MGGDAVVCGGFAVWLAVLGLVVRVTGATAFCHLSVAISSFPGVAFSPFLRCPGLFLAGVGGVLSFVACLGRVGSFCGVWMAVVAFALVVGLAFGCCGGFFRFGVGGEILGCVGGSRLEVCYGWVG